MCACGADRRAGWRQCCDSLKIKHLYEVLMGNDKTFETRTYLTVARDEKEAVHNAKRLYMGSYNMFDAIPIHEVEGYKISVDKR